ncbi:MAG: hypothetical protein J6L91_05845 [Clostridia bacterium]|nr:hypothetical protein [Clostridia bacterium]
MKSIGIDIGTTSICGISADCQSGEILKSVTLPNDSFIETDKSFERIQDSEKILKKVFSLVEELTDEGTVSIGFSNQMHGILYTDKNGNALSPLYIWQDARGNEIYKDGKTYAEAIGGFAGYGLVMDFYNRVNGLVPEDTAYCMSIGDFATMHLCKKTVPLMHITNGAAFGCFDIKESRFTVDLPYLPPITKDFAVVGEYKGIPVTVSVGDNQASFIGSVKDNDTALINVGTGSQVSVICDSPDVGDGLEARPFDGEKYLAAGCALCGGRAFAMVERFLARAVEIATGEKPDSLYAQIDKILETKKETFMKADSRFCGTRLDPTVTGSYTEITENNFTPEDMLLSTLYAMTNELYGMYSSSGKKCVSLVCSGNGIRKNAALRKITSKTFGCEVQVPFYKEEAAYGAALTSMAGAKIKTLEEARQLIRY